MKQPSERALAVAEQLVDYVHPGMSRSAATREIAEIIDEANAELVTAVEHLLAEAERFGTAASPQLLAELRHVCREFQPIPRVNEQDAQDLFGAKTPIQANLFSGEMP